MPLYLSLTLACRVSKWKKKFSPAVRSTFTFFNVCRIGTPINTDLLNDQAHGKFFPAPPQRCYDPWAHSTEIAIAIVDAEGMEGWDAKLRSALTARELCLCTRYVRQVTVSFNFGLTPKKEKGVGVLVKLDCTDHCIDLSELRQLRNAIFFWICSKCVCSPKWQGATPISGIHAIVLNFYPFLLAPEVDSVSVTYSTYDSHLTQRNVDDVCSIPKLHCMRMHYSKAFAPRPFSLAAMVRNRAISKLEIFFGVLDDEAAAVLAQMVQLRDLKVWAEKVDCDLLDLSHSVQVERLEVSGRGSIRKIRLPPNVVHFGDSMLGSGLLVPEVDFSEAPLVHTVGFEFCHGLRVHALKGLDKMHITALLCCFTCLSCTGFISPLPSSLTDIGERFGALTELSDGVVFDLSQCTALNVVPDHFLVSASASLFPLLPPSIKEIKNNFCANCSIHALDLSYLARLRKIGELFCWGSDFASVTLPRSVSSVGGAFCNQCKFLKKVDLSAVRRLKRIPNKFCVSSAVEGVELPATVITIGHQFLMATPIQTINLALCTKLSVVGMGFCLNAQNLHDCVLPASVRRIGDLFLAGTRVNSVDLTHCKSLKKLSARPLVNCAMPPHLQ